MLRLHYLSINSTSLLIRCTNVALFVYIRFTNLLIVWTLYSVIQLETNATNVVTCWSLAKKFNWAFLYYNIYNSSTVTLHTSNITHANEDQFHLVDGNPKNQTVSVKDLFKSLKNFQEGLPFFGIHLIKEFGQENCIPGEASQAKMGHRSCAWRVKQSHQVRQGVDTDRLKVENGKKVHLERCSVSPEF